MSDDAGALDPDAEAIAAALESERGNVSKAAGRLGVRSAWLRRQIMASEDLTAVMDEIMETHIDKAIGIIRAGMDEESYLVRFYAAKEFLRTEKARKRGFGMPAQAQIVEGGGGRPAVIVLKWIGDDEAEPKQIEGSLEP